MILDRTLETIKKWDVNLSYQIFKRTPKTKKTKSILKSLEWSCHGILWLAGTLSLMYLYPNNESFNQLMAGLIVDILYVVVLKAYGRRRRPSYASQGDQFGVILVDKHSFPSGHATRAIYVGFFMSSCHPIISFAVWIWAISVTISRVLLGRHHVGDIIAGVMVGFINYAGQFVIGIPLYDWIGYFFTSGLLMSFSSTNDLSDASLIHED